MFAFTFISSISFLACHPYIFVQWLFNSCIIVVSLPGLWFCTFVSGYQCVKQPPPPPPPPGRNTNMLGSKSSSLDHHLTQRRHANITVTAKTKTHLSPPLSLPPSPLKKFVFFNKPVPQHLHRESISHTIILNPRFPPQLLLNTR